MELNDFLYYVNPINIIEEIFFPLYSFIKENDDGNSSLFSSSKSLEDLRNFKGVLRDNGLEVSLAQYKKL